MRMFVLKRFALSALVISMVVATGFAGTNSSDGNVSAGPNVNAVPQAGVAAPENGPSEVPSAQPTNAPADPHVNTPPARDTNSAPKTSPTQPSLQERNPQYALRINDLFDVSFPFSPEFNETVRVPPDGWIPLVGARPVHVGGETMPQAIVIIRKAYAGVLHNPEILVLLKEFEKPYIIVSGEVNKPGKYDLLGDTTVTQAVALAGGFNKDAKHSSVVLFRRVSDEWTEANKIDVKSMLNSKNLAEDLHLRPGDMLYVPKSTMSKVKDYLPNYGMGINPAVP